MMYRAMFWFFSYMIISGFALTVTDLGKDFGWYWAVSNFILAPIWFNNARIRETKKEEEK